MQICVALAGYSLARADIVRRAMSKKKHDVMEKERQAFIYGEKDEKGNVICDGAINRGVSEDAAKRIFDDMNSFSSYAFNKSHAAAYAVVAYITAYLKCHYPKEYMAALLTSVLDRADKVAEYTEASKKMGISILPPSVNESLHGFTPVEKGIRFGLLAIKNLGYSVIENLIKERETGGKYTSFYDFCLRNSTREFNRRALEGLIKSGALDGLDGNRRQMLFASDSVMQAVDNVRRYTGGGQMDLFSDSEPDTTVSFQLPQVEELPRDQLLVMEKEATGMYLSGHPMAEYEHYPESLSIPTVSQVINDENADNKRIKILVMLSSIKVRTLKNKSVLLSAMAEDTTGSIPITCFAKVYEAYKPFFVEQKPILLTAKVSDSDDRVRELICERAEPIPPLPAYTALKPKTVYLRVKNLECDEFLKVKEILTDSNGNMPVIIYCTDTNKKFNAPKMMFLQEKQGKIEKIISLLGENNVKLVD